MSELLYRAHPSVWRAHPMGTLLVWLVLLAGAAIAITGQLPFLPALPPSALDLPFTFDLRWAGYLLLLVAALRLTGWWLASLADRIEIRSNEVVWTHGLLSRTYTEISMTSIRTVRIQQSLLQRILGAGDLVILTAGDVPELAVRGLPRPHEIREHIKQHAAGA